MNMVYLEGRVHRNVKFTLKNSYIDHQQKSNICILLFSVSLTTALVLVTFVLEDDHDVAEDVDEVHKEHYLNEKFDNVSLFLLGII